MELKCEEKKNIYADKKMKYKKCRVLIGPIFKENKNEIEIPKLTLQNQ